MDEIEVSQECYLSDDAKSLFNESEFNRYIAPTWLTLDKAKEIYDEFSVRFFLLLILWA